MKRVVLFYFLFFFTGSMMGQDIATVIDSVVRFYYPNGTLSSEGVMREGKPDGYWKSYHENGNIKSEGNRKRFVLDSLWKFYNSTGILILEISYEEGKKMEPKHHGLIKK